MTIHYGDPDKASHVDAPSIPRYAFSPFSEPADETPWSIARVARTWAELMRLLGYDRYGAHGDNAGALFSPGLAVMDSEHMIGVHITAGLGNPTGDPDELEDLTEEDGPRRIRTNGRTVRRRKWLCLVSY